MNMNKRYMALLFCFSLVGGVTAARAHARRRNKLADMRIVVSDVTHKKLVPDAWGAVALPPRYAYLSNSSIRHVHYAYATQAKGKVLVTFISWRGLGGNFTGIVMSSKPLTPSDFITDQDLNSASGAERKAIAVRDGFVFDASKPNDPRNMRSGFIRKHIDSSTVEVENYN